MVTLFKNVFGSKPAPNEDFRELLATAKHYRRETGFPVHDCVKLAHDTVRPYAGQFWRGGNRGKH